MLLLYLCKHLGNGSLWKMQSGFSKSIGLEFAIAALYRDLDD